ncbi:MAG: hypothetical protein KAS38_07550, partial [Anaerolineales bacterium]|nr:hypothetical protein [Anaerolineales bacterium]
SELLASKKMEKIMDDLKKVSGTIILDGPPFIVSDPIVLSSKVDGVLLVIKPGATKIEATQAMIEQLQRAGAWVVGVVLNPISRKQAGYYGKYRHYTEYYTSGYGYGQTSGGGQAPTPTQGETPA